MNEPLFTDRLRGVALVAEPADDEAPPTDALPDGLKKLRPGAPPVVVLRALLLAGASSLRMTKGWRPGCLVASGGNGRFRPKKAREEGGFSEEADEDDEEDDEEASRRGGAPAGCCGTADLLFACCCFAGAACRALT